MYQIILTGTALGVSMITDIKWRIVYKHVVALYLVLAMLGHIAGGTASLSEIGLGMVPGVIFLVVSWAGRQSIGYGDSLLLMICGASLGLESCIWITFTAFFWAGIWALSLYWFRRKKCQKGFPFVPFLFLGFIIQWTGGF